VTNHRKKFYLSEMLSDAEILEEARQYVKWDPNDETRSQIDSFLEASNVVELRSALSNRLAFGTAGLRGAMGAGYNKMNELVMLQTTQGISKYLMDQLGAEAKTKVRFVTS
jgi:phosphoglucomutase / phosphopentomutase